MKNTILWTNPSVSCLGDRLVDTMLLLSLAKIKNADLHFDWLDCIFQFNNVGDPVWQSEPGNFTKWDQVRFKDYRYENYTQYFELPSDLKINQPVKNPNFTFTDYLGGVFSPYSFWEKYINNEISFEAFTEIFKSCLREFRPKEKLLKLIKGKPVPTIGVHLRRTDKIREDSHHHTSMKLSDLEELDNLTLEAIEKFNDNNNIFYFASDDNNIRSKFELKYNNHIEHEFITEFDFEKTYIDLYMLSLCETIILSQRHSNFSVFASMIGDSRLIYLYRDALIDIANFSKSDKFIFYKDL